MMFDLKKDPWYIRVNSPEESEAVQKWLFEQGFLWVVYGKHVKYTNEPILSNTDYFGEVCQKLMHGSSVNSVHPSCMEVTPVFECITRVQDMITPEILEKIEIGGKQYYKEDVEKALQLLKPIN